MTTFFACLALDIAVPAVVLLSMIAVNDLVLWLGDIAFSQETAA